MLASYPIALGYLLVHEGGWSNNPRDPGGATMRGVTQRKYDEWRSRKGLPLQSVRLITTSECADLYREDYWDKCRGDDLPAGVDYCVFDYAVNSGVSRSVHCLQTALGVVSDGVIGPKTLAACFASDPASVIETISNQRHVFLGHLSNFGVFGHGWTDRVVEVEAQAKGMIA